MKKRSIDPPQFPVHVPGCHWSKNKGAARCPEFSACHRGAVWISVYRDGVSTNGSDQRLSNREIDSHAQSAAIMHVEKERRSILEAPWHPSILG